MLESFSKNKFTYKKLSLEEQKARGILGRLEGIIADTKKPTRNGRKYSQDLWEKVFNNPIMKEKIENRCCFGELGHPTDREEVDIEKVAICLAEQPKLGDDGKIYGVFDILSTPAGNILKSLCDYGCRIGVSSRGTGDLFTDNEGNESVDPDTYNCECWDAVLIPAVKEARLDYVNESLSKKRYNKTLQQAITESYNKADVSSKKALKEALDTMGISLTEEESEMKENKEQLSEEYKLPTYRGVPGTEFIYHGEWADPEIVYENNVYNYNDVEDVLYNLCDEDIRDDEEKFNEFVIKEFPYIISEIEPVETANDEEESTEDEDVNEDCNSESCENKKSDEVVDDKADDSELIAELQEALKEVSKLESDNLSLQQNLSVCIAKEKELSEQLGKYKHAVANLSESSLKLKDTQEDLTNKDQLLEEAKIKISSLIKTNEELNQNLDKASKEVTGLKSENESLKESLNDSKNKLSESTQRLNQYKRSYKELKEHYLNVRSSISGVSKKDLLNNLNESYTIKDIDSKCEELSKINKSITKLPFVLTEDTKISIQSAVEPKQVNTNDDDYVSQALLHFTNL